MVSIKTILPVLRVDLTQLVQNYHLLAKFAQPITLAAVLKGNAYGLGMEQIIAPLFDSGCRHFFFADWQEVINLPEEIKFGSKLYALAGVEPNEYHDAIQHNIVPILHREDQIKEWAKFNLPCGIQVGMSLNRLGVDLQLIPSLSQIVQIEFILNHLSCGYNILHPSNIAESVEIAELSRQIQIPATLCSSCAFVLDRDLILEKSCMIRAGRCVYGIVPREFKEYGIFGQLKPIATLTAVLIAIRDVKKSQSIGYNEGFIAQKDMRIGILNIGYSSGYCFNHRGEQVYFEGEYYNIISQSMDFTTIDVGGLNCNIGDRFELFGENISQDSPEQSRIFLPGKANIVREYIK